MQSGLYSRKKRITEKDVMVTTRPYVDSHKYLTLELENEATSKNPRSIGSTEHLEQLYKLPGDMENHN